MDNKEQKSFPRGYFGDATTEVPAAETIISSTASFRRAFLEFVKSLPRDARVLDAGCGKGKFAITVLSLRPDIELYGMDITDTSLMLPRGIKFKVGSVERLDKMYEKDFFDAVICGHVIEHLLYPLSFMEGIKKILKPNGLFYLETPNWSRALVPFLDSFFWNDYTHIRIFTKQTLGRLFADYNFDVIKLFSVSSSSFFMPTGNLSQIKRFYHKNISNKASIGLGAKIIQFPRLFFSFFSKIIARIVSVFLRDVLVAVVLNKK